MQGRRALRRLVEAHPEIVPFAELDRLLLSYGFERRPVHMGVLHYVYVRDKWVVTLPYQRLHVGAQYVREVLRILDEVDEQDAAGDD